MGPSPYQIDDPSELLSPSLVIFRDLVQKNLEMMIAMAGSASRLRPHAKTHKMPAVTAMGNGSGDHQAQVRHDRRGGDDREGRRK